MHSVKFDLRRLATLGDCLLFTHRSLYELGKNLDEAARIMALPPVRQAVELTKISGKLTAPKAPTKATPPIKPLAAVARTEVDLENAPMAEFVKIRDKQEADRIKERGR